MRASRLSRARTAALSLALAAAWGPALAQPVILEPGFAVRTIPRGTEPFGRAFGRPEVMRCGRSAAFGDALYIGFYVLDFDSGWIDRLDSAGSLVLLAGAGRPLGLAFGPGPELPFGDSLYIADFNRNTVRSLHPSAGHQTVLPVDHPVWVAVDPTGDLGYDLFVQTEAEILRMDAAGDVSTFEADSSATGPWRFGPGGSWGTSPCAIGFAPGQGGGLVRISPDGTLLLVSKGSGRDFDWAAGERFGGDLFLSAPGEVFRVKPDGSRTPWAHGGGGLVAFCHGALYLSEGCPGGYCRVTEQEVVQVEVDVRPGVTPNVINLNSSGIVPAAILGSAAFDVTTVDPATVQLAGSRITIHKGSGRLPCSIEDVNDDGFSDLLCRFEAEEFSLLGPGSASAALDGETADRTAVVHGQDSVHIVH